MRFSLSWIQEYVKVDDSLEDLAERLTMAGLPVDQIDTTQALPDTVVVGRVVEAGQHPNADRLSVCKVDVGARDLLDIVCGAPNARAGIFSPVAMVGTTLPNGLTLKRAKIRGAVSEGMLCSEIELGIGPDADGIMEIPEAAPGTLYQLTLGDPAVNLEVDIPANRGDALSHLGISREIAALTEKNLEPPRFEVVEKGEPVEKSFEVTVENLEDCPRFTAHIIRGIQVGPSPEWLVARLESIGQRSINNIVDITNFVMQEMGQPLHSFDLQRLGTGRIHVRRARSGEQITTLDGVNRDLSPEVLLITDGERPIAVGGVMGASNTEVHEGTTDILLEAACFRPERVLWGSRYLKLDTDASLRFRRGVDPAVVSHAAKRAAVLIAELGGGSLAPGMVEVAAPGLLDPRTVDLRPEKVGEVIGDPVPGEEIEQRLKSLGFEVPTPREGPWPIQVPSWRRDVLDECDLVEEIARHRGYDTIGVRQFNASGVPAGVQPEEELRKRIRRILSGFGYQETVTRVLVESGAAERGGLSREQAAREFFPVLDPPSREEEGLRVSILPSLLDALGHNIRHGQIEARLFEIGKTFHRSPEDEGDEPGALPIEVTWIAMAASGGDFAPSLERGGRNYDFLDFKGAVEGLLGSFRIDAPKWRSYNGMDLVPEGALEVLAGDASLGFAWEVNTKVRSGWDLSRPVFLAQLRLEALSLDTDRPVRYREASRFPAVRRDLALVVPEAIHQGQIRSWIESKAGGFLEGLELFDYYRGKHIPDGHLGLGFSLIFRAADRTLEEKEVDANVNKIVKDLKQRGIVRRES